MKGGVLGVLVASLLLLACKGERTATVQGPPLLIAPDGSAPVGADR
jgi:hypothetical protein